MPNVRQGDQEMEAEAKAWIEAVLGEPLPEGSFADALKSGVVLCNLVNAVQPGACKAPTTKKMAFMQMENIAAYLAACLKLGQRPQESFQTIDLFEAQNMMQVLLQIHSLGRIAQTLGFSGPTLGAKLATENKREFTEAQLIEAKGAATFLGKGSHGTEGSKVDKAERLAGSINKNVKGVEGLGMGSDQTFLGRGSSQTTATEEGQGKVVDPTYGADYQRNR